MFIKKRCYNVYFYAKDLGDLCDFYWTLRNDKLYGRYKLYLKKYDIENRKYRLIMPVRCYTIFGTKLVHLLRKLMLSVYEEYNIY